MSAKDFAALMDRELAAAHAAMDAKEHRLDTYGYGGNPSTPIVSQDYAEAVQAAQPELVGDDHPEVRRMLDACDAAGIPRPYVIWGCGWTWNNTRKDSSDAK